MNCYFRRVDLFLNTLRSITHSPLTLKWPSMTDRCSQKVTTTQLVFTSSWGHSQQDHTHTHRGAPKGFWCVLSIFTEGVEMSELFYYKKLYAFNTAHSWLKVCLPTSKDMMLFPCQRSLEVKCLLIFLNTAWWCGHNSTVWSLSLTTKRSHYIDIPLRSNWVQSAPGALTYSNEVI